MKKTSAVTIRLEPALQKLLDKVCKQSGRTRSDILREALKRQLAILRFAGSGCRPQAREAASF
ncbi:MAG: ribbon-helix-helix protein, CopG family [Terriglobales bacterium]